MKQSTKIWIGVGVAVIIIGGTITYFVLQNQKDKKNTGKGASNEGEKGETDSLTIGSEDKRFSDGFPLKLLSKGRNVLMVQRALNMTGERVTEDGVFGKETAVAADWRCMGLGANANPACTMEKKEFDALMKKAGGEQKVLTGIKANATLNKIYNSYQ